MNNRTAKYVPKIWHFQIKYDWRKAYQAGWKGSPIDHMKKLGYNVVNYEVPMIDRRPVLECTLFEVTNRRPSPDYIEEIPPFWNFEKKAKKIK